MRSWKNSIIIICFLFTSSYSLVCQTSVGLGLGFTLYSEFEDVVPHPITYNLIVRSKVFGKRIFFRAQHFDETNVASRSSSFNACARDSQFGLVFEDLQIGSPFPIEDFLERTTNEYSIGFLFLDSIAGSGLSVFGNFHLRKVVQEDKWYFARMSICLMVLAMD